MGPVDYAIQRFLCMLIFIASTTLSLPSSPPVWGFELKRSLPVKRMNAATTRMNTIYSHRRCLPVCCYQARRVFFLTNMSDCLSEKQRVCWCIKPDSHNARWVDARLSIRGSVAVYADLSQRLDTSDFPVLTFQVF